jgi:hypothetical protein
MLSVARVIKVEMLQVTFCGDQGRVLFGEVATDAASASRMIFVVFHADPTELMPALHTSHVHAALIFVDGCGTLRALLRVQFDPGIRVLFSIACALFPVLQRATVEGLVSHLGALEAEIVLAAIT